MLLDLISALPAALLVCVAPGWFWAASLRGGSPDLVERLTFSIAFSLALVPPVALAIMWVSGTGVTTLVAALAPLIVLVCGLAVRLIFGSARAPEYLPSLSLPFLPPSALLALIPALGFVFWAFIASSHKGQRSLVETPIATLITAALVLLTGTLAWRASRMARPSSRSPRVARRGRRFVFPVALTAVLGFVLARGYVGPVLYDWPYLRGGDQYNHAVQANEMLAVGNYDDFLVYPPGFSTLTAGVSRLAGLTPLEVFPVLAPALILLPALACYALAKGLCGRWGGLAAATFSGLLVNSVWNNIALGRYPNLVAAQFLLVLVVAALIHLYYSPGSRPVLALALLGSSVVLYHSVGSFYAALLLALVAALFIPLCLILGHRRQGVALLVSLTLLGALSVVYAWDTYDLGKLLGGLLTGTETGAGGEAVSIVVGTQPAFPLAGLPGRVSSAVFWFGLLGLLLLFAPGIGPKDLSKRLSTATLLLWCAILFGGSRTALSAFPQRFERDLGIPLSVLAALALVAVLHSFYLYITARNPTDGPVRGSVNRFPVRSGIAITIAAVATVLALTLVGTQALANLERIASPKMSRTLTPEVAAAGEWLREHNSGGKILPTPSYESTTSRGMLALGGYDGLQSYPERRVRAPRSLPPGGAREIKDARWMLLHPQGERTRNIIGRYDLRYAVLSKNYPDTDISAFKNGPYRKVFENEAVVIFAPS